MRNNEKGITLIALVVTIVVLLILAGVSISMLTGENGIIKQAQDAKTRTEEAKEKEEDILTKYENYIKDKTEEQITASYISNSEDKDKYYGKPVVNYECENSDGVQEWLIFYADNSNIYLIAKENVNYQYVPSSANYEIQHIGDKQIYFSGVVNDYIGSKSIINDSVKKWISYINEYSESTQRNIKAVAYLLDTNIWNVFAGDKAEYAIGGPTIELFCASYQQRHNEKIYYKIMSETGYYISRDNETFGNQLTINSEDKLYNSGTTWLATPSQSGSTYLMCMGGGIVRSADYTYTPAVLPGIRPIVCLKSDVVLEEYENDTFIIRED